MINTLDFEIIVYLLDDKTESKQEFKGMMGQAAKFSYQILKFFDLNP